MPAAAGSDGAQADVNGHQFAALHADLARLGAGADRARLLLTALAWARGAGVPRGVWVAVARVLAQSEGPGHPAMNDSGVGWLLQVGRRWVTTEKRPDSTAVYRLADAQLATQLRDSGLQGPVAPRERADVERRITQALVATVPMDSGGGRDWLHADAYLASHLVQHAAAAGQSALGDLVADATFRAVADPAALVPLLGAVALSQRDSVRAYRRARPMLGTNPHANAAYLEEAARALGAGEPSTLAGGIRPVYRTLLSAMRHDDSLATLTGHTNMINAVRMGTCPDGRVLVATGSDDATVRVWDALSGELACPVITGHTDEVWGIALGNCADGRPLLASCSRDKTVRVWDPLTGAPVVDPITGHTERVYEVAFGNLEDGRPLLASGSGDTTARLWDPLTGAAFGAPLTGHHGRVRSVAFGNLPDGRLLLATSSPDGPVHVWDALKGKPVSPPVTTHPGSVRGLEFCPAPDGNVLLCTSGVDGTVRFWDPLTGEPEREPFPALSEPLYVLKFGTDGKGRHRAAYARGGAHIHVCDPGDVSQPPRSLASLGGKVQGMAFGTVRRDGDAAGGRLLLASSGVDLNVRVWDRLDGDSAGPDAMEPGWVRSLVFGDGPGGQVLLASATGGNDLCLWDPRAGVRVRQLPTGGEGWVDCAAFGAASDGRLLLASGGRYSAGEGASIQVWNPLTGDLVAGPLTGHGETVRSLAFGMGPGGRLLLASASDDGTVRVWDSLTGAPLGRPVAAHSDRAESVAMVSLPGRGLLMASGGGDGAVRLWDPVTGTPATSPLTGHTDRVTSVAFGADAAGQLLLASASDDGTVRLWHPLAARPAVKTLLGHVGGVATVAFAAGAGGRPLLVSGGSDATVRVWAVGSVSGAVTIRRPSSVRVVAASGLLLAVGQDEGFSVIELDPEAPPH